MDIAIIGAGFSGLALAWHLLQDKSCRVAIFDPKGIGGEASGMATGLLHPYAGEQARRSWQADAALEATKELLLVAEKRIKKPVCCSKGIIRRVQSTAQAESLFQHIKTYQDVEKIDDSNFLVLSGVTVYAKEYLEGLFLACQERGAILHNERVDNLKDLHNYDAVILAAGAGLLQFDECKDLPIKCVKGQVLTCVLDPSLPALERSIVSKGYVAKGPDPAFFYCGATYEHGLSIAEPDLSFALKDLTPKIEPLLPRGYKLDVVDCRAAFRVTAVGHYFPIVRKLKEKCYVMGAMGSRGLLYHGLMAKLLSQAILMDDDSYLLSEVKNSLCKKAILK